MIKAKKLSEEKTYSGEFFYILPIVIDFYIFPVRYK